LFVRHLLGVEPSTSIDGWPIQSICGKFHLDPRENVNEVSNLQGMEFFVNKYIEAYHSQTFQPSRSVLSEYVSPSLIQEMYQDNFLVLRNLFESHVTDVILRQQDRTGQRQQADTRRERKRKVCDHRRTFGLLLMCYHQKFQRRKTALSGQFNGESLTRLYSAICSDTMSEEESDEDDPTLIWIAEPAWRSPQLAVFLHQLDSSFKPARRRVFRPSTNDSAAIPERLPINFYSKEWVYSSSIGPFITSNAVDPLILEVT
jgi:hypothetical protein